VRVENEQQSLAHSSKRKLLTYTLCALLLALSNAASAQQMPRVGFLGTTSPSDISARIEALRQGLREIGYIEGQNISIEYRWAEGKPDRLPKLAAELVNLRVDIIVTHGDVAIRTLKQATRTIPIVVGVTGDLVARRHAVSLARPGGNITGLVDTSPELSGKRLEILKEILPMISRIAVLWNGANAVKRLDFKETEAAAQALGLRLQSVKVKPSVISTVNSKLQRRPAPLLWLYCRTPSYPQIRRRLSISQFITDCRPCTARLKRSPQVA
jgi:putative tryptophan/tyrosine transport system substrate-binding protein